MDALWEKIKNGSCTVPPRFSSNVQDALCAVSDTIKILGDDYSYVASRNGNRHHIITTLSESERRDHPKFIHAKGIVGRFIYTPRGANTTLSGKPLSGIFRFGPADKGQANLLGFGFQFYAYSHKEPDSSALHSLVMLGGSTKPIDYRHPPKIGDILFYSTDTTLLNAPHDNENVEFLSRAFSDLVTNPNLIDTTDFVGSGSKTVKFTFTRSVLEALDHVYHTNDVITQLCTAFNNLDKNITSIGYFYVDEFFAGKQKSTPVILGTLSLIGEVIISPWADQHLFFQHSLVSMKSNNPSKCRGGVNQNRDHFTVSNVIRRVWYVLTTTKRDISIACFSIACFSIVIMITLWLKLRKNEVL